uniref:Xylose isomerase-like TIM barrel domain-containing protein n=1 Tax=Panagrolaimus sp. PS1159 TaxID=55785 RepID=A0AC35G803_9BILA
MGKRAASTLSSSAAAAETKIPRKIKKEIYSQDINVPISTESSTSSSAGNDDVKSVIKKVKKEIVIVEKTEAINKDIEAKVIGKTEIETTVEKFDANEKKVKTVRKTAAKVKVEKPAWTPALKAEYETIGKSVLASVGKSKKYLGAHVSASGGVENAVYNAMAIGCRSFALFLKNQRRWDSKSIEEDSIQRWHAAIKETEFDLKMIVPHGSYLLNAGSPNSELREKTKASILDEIRRCESLGIGLYNFHPGSSCGKCNVEESIEYIAEILNEVIEETNNVILLVETMSGQGNTVGGKFEELKSIIDHVKESNRHRVGVCLDTCHIFAAGYDIRTAETYEKTMKDFDEIIGFKNLKAVHVNDCKSELGSHLDRHENIGKGNLKSCWQFFMDDSRFENIPLILETPEGLYPTEMIKLYGMDRNNKESSDAAATATNGTKKKK